MKLKYIALAALVLAALASCHESGTVGRYDEAIAAAYSNIHFIYRDGDF